MGTKNLYNQMRHEVHEMYQRGYGTGAADRKNLRQQGEHVVTMKQTQKQMEAVCRRYADWMKETHPEVRKMEQAREYVREYSDSLKERYSAATVHTYTDRLNQVLHTDVRTSRAGAVPTKGRDASSEINSRADKLPGYSPRLSNFAEAVGIRRAEYADLKYKDIQHDEQGWKVIVEHGKGGKYQEQRILPQHERAVEKIYLQGRDEPERYVFSRSEMTNKIDLHEMRRNIAREAYEGYLGRIRGEEGYADRLYNQLKDTYQSRNPGRELPRDFRLIEQDGYGSVYKTRGDVRKNLKQRGCATKYNRLAALATSVNHLSHWRCDVTIQNYFR